MLCTFLCSLFLSLLFYTFPPSFLLSLSLFPSVAARRRLSCPLLLALLVEQMSVSGRCSRELGATVRAAGFGGLSRLFTLVSQEVAKRRKLAAVAAVFPALGLGPAVEHADVACCVVRMDVWVVLHHWWHRVHDWLVGHGANASVSFPVPVTCKGLIAVDAYP